MSEIPQIVAANPSVLLVGEFMWPWYQEACAEALEFLQCTVVRFGWFSDFRKWVPGVAEPVYRSLYHRIQYRFLKGPIVKSINKRLLKVAQKENPDIIWLYNARYITVDTVKKLRLLLPKTVFCQYSNDNPFSPHYKSNRWQHYLASIPYFDLHFAYRSSNFEQYYQYGGGDIHLLRSYFLPDIDSPVPENSIPNSYRCDVVFAGHYEDDERVVFLEAICNAGFRLKLYGGGWDAALPKLGIDSPLRAQFPISPATGIHYRYAICGAKVALCFLSKLNQDTYTRRNFQIPAMKTAMLSQYTEDLASLFKFDEEVMFFKTKQDLLEKVQLLVHNDERRLSLAEAGYKKVYSGGHDVTSRMKMWLQVVQQWQNRKDCRDF